MPIFYVKILKIRHLSSQNNSKKSDKQVSFPYDGGGHFFSTAHVLDRLVT